MPDYPSGAYSLRAALYEVECFRVIPRKAAPGSGDSSEVQDGARRTVRIATVSHTLDSDVAERLRYFAFRERISESAVIEFALRALFTDPDDAALGRRLRDAGAALRRRT